MIVASIQPDGAAISSLYLCLRLVTLLVVAHASFAGARLVITLQAVHLQASPVAIGVLVSLIAAVPALVAVPVGRWSDRVGHLPPTLVGFSVLVGGELIAWLFPGLLSLAAASVLVGTGFTLAHVSVNHAIGRAAGPAERVRAFGITGMGFSLSALVGPMLAGIAIDQIGHARAFAVLAVLPVLSALMLLRLPEIARPAPVALAAGTGGALGLLRDAPLRAVLIVSSLVAMGWDLFTFLVPLYGARLGLSATAIGAVVGAFGVGSFAARLALPWIARAGNEWKVLRAVLVLAALGYLAFPFCERVATLLPLALVIGMVLGCGQPLVMALLIATAPVSRTGEVVGLRTSLTSVGQVVLPVLFGAVGAAVGMGPLFWAAAAVMGVGGAVGRR